MEMEIERAKAVFRDLRAQLTGGKKRTAATKKLLEQLFEAATGIGEKVDAVWDDDDHVVLYVRVGKAGGAWIEEKNGRVVMRLDKSNREHEPKELPLTFDVELEAWVGGIDADIAPTPGQKLPRVPGVLVVAKAIAECFLN